MLSYFRNPSSCVPSSYRLSFYWAFPFTAPATASKDLCDFLSHALVIPYWETCCSSFHNILGILQWVKQGCTLSIFLSRLWHRRRLFFLFLSDFVSLYHTLGIAILLDLRCNCLISLTCVKLWFHVLHRSNLTIADLVKLRESLPSSVAPRLQL